jgi:preprotein translocase subunit SecG
MPLYIIIAIIIILAIILFFLLKKKKPAGPASTVGTMEETMPGESSETTQDTEEKTEV